MVRKTLVLAATIFTLTFVLSANAVFAAGTTMSISPQSGSYGAPFPVSLVIDGHGDQFNAAQATVTVSKNLMINNLILGDCNFSFLKTPSTTDPSFSGAIFGGSSKKCTVYTLTLSPLAKGNAKVSLSKASVKRYGNAAEILSSHQDASYTLTGTSGSGKQTDKTAQLSQTPIPTPANGLYAVIIKVLSGDNTPVNQATVTFNTATASAPLKATTDTTGTVHFTSLKSGVYTATVEKQHNQLAKTILTVAGANHVLTLGINLKAQQNNPLLKPQKTQAYSPLFIGGILFMGILVGVGGAILPSWLKRRKKAKL